MKTLTHVWMIFFVCLAGSVQAQTVFVDVSKGRDEATGTSTDPVASLEKAVALAGEFTGNEPVTIKIYPGLYVLNHSLLLKTRKQENDIQPYTIEAAVMPDDTAWQPASMPVIQSVSPDNSTVQFKHCGGIIAGKNNIHIRGLKFTGNANPTVKYYYPVSRENELLSGLEVSQCYFTGEKNSSPIQGAIWAHGAGIKVDHCIFHGCKNSLLLFKAIKDFSCTYSIIDDSYESAVWFGPFNNEFEFSNNIVANCNYFWVRPDSTAPKYTFSNSLITNCTHYMGFYSRMGLVPAEKNSHMEKNVRRTGKVVLSEVKTEGLPKDYLNPLAGSDGSDLKAGIFKLSR
jgi:hypothetical protein